MSFQSYPQPDACRALMPTPEPPPPGPPSRPMACHMPKGHDGQHALVRRPGPIDRRWEGDARPPAPQTAVALLGEHRHGTPPGGVLACQPSWHATCRNCRKPIALCFESGGHPIWLHDNPYPGAPYSRCLPATYAEPTLVVTEAVGQHTTDEEDDRG